MIGQSERRSAHFLEWEARGRGHRVWPHPVSPEPPFAPFQPPAAVALDDDGRKPTLLSSVVRRLSERLAPAHRADGPDDDRAEDAPDAIERSQIEEYQAYLPTGLRFDPVAYTALFASLVPSAEPIAFEIIGSAEKITVQFAVHPSDASRSLSHWEAFIPDVGFAGAPGYLAGLWGSFDESATAVAEFGLAREFVLPLRALRIDPFVGIAGALSEIGTDEMGLLQVIFAPATPKWRESTLRSVTHADGSALFVNASELLPAAREKLSLPLFGTVVRVAARAASEDRAWQIAVNIGAALGVYGSPAANELLPLPNDGYPAAEHAADVILRQSRRSGMLLNAEELAGFVHLPSAEVKSPRLRQEIGKTKAAPDIVTDRGGLRLGMNSHAGISTIVCVSEETRVRHTHIIGATGTGKSTLLFNLIRQSIERGEGCSVLDPHGDLVDRVLGIVPESRLDDVVLLDPSDEEYAVGFNVLAAHSDWEKALLASDLVAVFRRQSTSWGDQLNSVLSNALLAFMESERGGTLFDVRRFLLEPKFRAEYLASVRDPNVSYYWRHAFPMLTGNRSVGPVVTRLDTFLSPKPIRYMVAQKENRLDFRGILDRGKIFLAKLPEGAIGKENSHLLGSLVVSKMQAAAMSRQRENSSARRFHTLIADEFHSFLTPSLAECLSGVRKYRLGLVLAHQEMRQVERDADVASALLNAGTRIVFRVNDRDARALEGGFASFEARDLQNLSTGQAICRVERGDFDFNLSVDLLPYPEDREAWERRERATRISREKYARPRSEIEREFVATNESGQEPKPASTDSHPRDVPREPFEARKPIASEGEKASGTAPVAEHLPPCPPREKVQEPRTATTPGDLGRGGAQHRAVQDRIKQEAETLGFRVFVEKAFEGLGQIDLVLERERLSIACEVTVENTIDYEVGNVSKCLKAGFAHVAVIGVSEEKLAKLQSAVSNSLAPDKATRVAFYLPDAFISELRGMPNLAAATLEAQPTRTRGGRVVRRKVVTLSAEEAKTREREALGIMARLMSQRSRSSPI